MAELSFQVPNNLSNPTTLPEDMKRTLTQLRSQNNRGAGVVKQPVTAGGKVPRGRKRGDMGSRPTTRGVALRTYADKDSSREVEVTEASATYMGIRSGTAAPTTDDFADGQAGWWYNTATSTMYSVANFGGTIYNVNPATLGIAFTNISGAITDDQHGARGRVTSGTSPQPLHTNATSTQAGFMAATDKAKLDAATDTATASVIMMRDSNANAFAARFDATTSFRIGGTKVVGARQTGWAIPTGTTARGTFDTESVTLVQLARRVYSLIADLGATSGHGLIDA
jgi:hypothetical protein